MLKALFFFLCLCFFAPSSIAQDGPEPNPADVASVDATIGALYDVISGPAGPRDRDRLRSLTTPSCRLTPTGMDSTGAPRHVTWSVDDYVKAVSGYFELSGFFEIEIARKTERYDNMVQAFSTYESYRSQDDAAPFQRGINSIQYSVAL